MLDYTLGQFHAYIEAAQRRERRAQRDLLVATYVGFSGGQLYDQTLKHLSED